MLTLSLNCAWPNAALTPTDGGFEKVIFVVHRVWLAPAALEFMFLDRHLLLSNWIIYMNEQGLKLAAAVWVLVVIYNGSDSGAGYKVSRLTASALQRDGVTELVSS